MGDDSSRLDELRRRVHADPASIAFAALAEEYRRTGQNEEAVGTCVAGLTHHPDFLPARVTLGRALLELGRLDEALTELKTVLAGAPDNLAANRALAEVYQKQGQLPEALAQFKRALELATIDPDIETEVQRIESVVAPAPPPEPTPERSAAAVEDLFDFDTLLEQLGGRTQPKPDMPAVAPVVAPSVVEQVQLSVDPSDPLSTLEQQLRETEHKVYVAGPSEDELHERRVLAELEGWLGAIVADRNRHLSA